ncbi:NusG domain II-containing protein [Candidatus Cryosericum terrychapinii]|uniref:NusG domain II-containing protein n=1 Tax=Candidatus Cryosericum terrychapinii TaxID=2290919 RepID=A0A398D0P3_9BACT|nr:NusG domain II-containing protein [Candidatus Cryosericum terrychapinii]RIE06308.1 NusG domain II-containing protein [Candidatus Cryosericum terrychapinii]
MKRSDRITAVVILTAVVLVVVSWIVMHRTRGTVAFVYVDGKVVATVDLTLREPQTLPITGMLGPLVVAADGKGSIRVVESTCPDQICVHTVPARSPGDQIICVPNRMVIIIEGKGTNIDALTQ